MRRSWRSEEGALVQWVRRRGAGGGEGRRATRLAGKGLAAVGAAGLGRRMGLPEEEGGLPAGRGLRQTAGWGEGWGGAEGMLTAERAKGTK